MGNGHVGPPIPGRHDDFLRNVVNAIDGTTFVTTDYNQSLLHAGHGFGHHLDEKVAFSGTERGKTPFNGSLVMYAAPPIPQRGTLAEINSKTTVAKLNLKDFLMVLFITVSANEHRKCHQPWIRLRLRISRSAPRRYPEESGRQGCRIPGCRTYRESHPPA